MRAFSLRWGRFPGIHFLSFGRPLKVGLAVALMLPEFMNYGLGSSLEQSAQLQGSTLAAQNSARQASSAGQNQQTTPQNPPPPTGINPPATEHNPPPSQQYPAPSAELPEPAIKDPEVRAAPRAAVVPPSLTIPRLNHAPTLEDFLSMKPEGEIAEQMVKVTGFAQRSPYDGAAVSEETEAYLGYDEKNLYLVFVCFDDPKKIRARMSRREEIYDDDEVAVLLDTFHDRRRAYEFQTTALGVQWDAIYTEASRDETGGNWDTSFDTVWDSRGKVTSRGFVVWMAIPFKSLRFPATRQQEWGIILYRGIVRKNEDAFWPAISRRVEGRLGQAGT